MPAFLSPIGLVSAAIAVGAVTPVPLEGRAIAWSTTLGAIVAWNGTNWQPIVKPSAANVATVAPTTTTETQIIGLAIPANSVVVGTTWRIRAFGQCTATTATANNIFRVRCGPTTLTGAIAASVNVTSASGTLIGFDFEALVTVTSISSSGAVLIGEAKLQNGGTTGLSNSVTPTFSGPNGTAIAAVAPGSGNFTVAQILELNLQIGATTVQPSIYAASIERVAL